MTRDLPQVFEKFGNIVTDVKLVIELHRIKNKQVNQYSFLHFTTVKDG
jgi:hypothetical protein